MMNAYAPTHAFAATAAPAPGLAVRTYLRVGVASQVAAASPHRLVALLYDRLARLTLDAHAAATAGDRARRLAATERAIAIVEGLDATLDTGRGGEVAKSLQQIYALLRDRLLQGEAPGLAQAAESAAAIADAWRRIG
jgi:flagellar protein FliS